MRLNELRDNAGARKAAVRVGRGIGSGKGKTSGRGHKGLGARSGGKVALGFEGGQNPIYRRLPMRGFNNANFTKQYCIVNIGDLQHMVDEKRIDAQKEITIDVLREAGVTKKAYDGLKVLGNGEAKVALNITAAAASKSAVAKIEKAGGKITLPAAE